MHFLQVFLQYLSFKRSHRPQEASRIACPDLPLLHLYAVSDHCTCSHYSSGVDGGVTDGGTHRDEGSVLEGCALQDGIGAHEDVITYGGTAGHVYTVLQDGVVPYADGSAAKKGSTVPDGGVSSYDHVAQDGGVGCHEGGLLEGGLLSLVGQSTQTGSNAVLAEGLSLQLVAHLVQSLAGSAQCRSKHLLVETIEDLVDHHSHQIIITQTTHPQHVNAPLSMQSYNHSTV